MAGDFSLLLQRFIPNLFDDRKNEKRKIRLIHFTIKLISHCDGRFPFFYSFLFLFLSFPYPFSTFFVPCIPFSPLHLYIIRYVLIKITGIDRKNGTEQALIQIIWSIPSQDSSCFRDSKRTPFKAGSKLGISQIFYKTSCFVSFILPISV